MRDYYRIDSSARYMTKSINVMRKNKFILGSSLMRGFSSIQNRNYTYSMLTSDIDSLESDAFGKDVLVMNMTGYFKLPTKGCCEILLSIPVVSKILNIYNLDEKKRNRLVKYLLMFDCEDYDRHYEEWRSEQELNKLLDKNKESARRYTSPYKTRMDILEDRAKELRSNATDAEKSFRSFLDKIGINYIFQHPVKLSGAKECIYDFFLPEQNIDIEIDGEYHNSKEQTMSDDNRDRESAWNGILVLRLSNMQATYPTQELYTNICKLTGIAIDLSIIESLPTFKDFCKTMMKR